MSKGGQAAEQNGRLGEQLLVAGSMCQIACASRQAAIDLGHRLGAALLAEPLLGALVALGVGGVAKRVHGRLEQRPAQVGRPVLGQRPAAVAIA